VGEGKYIRDSLTPSLRSHSERGIGAIALTVFQAGTETNKSHYNEGTIQNKEVVPKERPILSIEWPTCMTGSFSNATKKKIKKNKKKKKKKRGKKKKKKKNNKRENRETKELI